MANVNEFSPMFCPGCGRPALAYEQMVAKGFRSRAQWRWCFANGEDFCHRWAHETPGGKTKRYRKLPQKVRGKSKGGRAKRMSGGIVQRD